MSGVQIPISAQFDSAQLDKALAQLAEQINKLGTTVADANKVKFNPIDKATLQDIERVKQQYESLTKISQDFRKRLRDTGQKDSDFFDLDWSKMYVDPNVRARQMRKAYDYVTDGTGVSFSEIPKPAPPAAPTPPNPPGGGNGGGGGSGGGGGRRPGGGARPGGGGGGAANDDDGGGDGNGGNPPSLTRQVFGSGLRATGQGGAVADDALSTGLSEGAMAGMSAALAGFMVLATGKLVSAIKGQVGNAEQQQIGYDTLKRQLGDVGVQFDVLRKSMEATSESMSLTYAEGQQLAKQFSKLAGMAADTYKSLPDEIRNSAGFGRSFGLDPAQATAFFATMRNFQETRNPNDSRALAVMIGEAIAKSGAFAKADEMLQAISSYTTQQTRLGIASANVDGYASELTGLVASKTPGLDPTGASNLLSRVNSSIAGGGSAGEAGQSFMYMTLGKQLGLDPIQTRLLQQQGAFGTAASTFGSGPLADWMKKNGVSTSKAALGSNATNLEMILAAINRIYSGSPERRELGLNAGANLLGINESSFAALSSIAPKNLHGLLDRLKKNHIDLSTLDPTNISKLAQIESSKDLSDSQKDAAIKEAAPQSQEQTEGAETRRTLVGIQNELVKQADRLVPLMNDMRAGILYMAGDGGQKGPREIQAAVITAEHDENRRAINKKYDALHKEQDDLEKKWGSDRITLGRKLQDPKVSDAEKDKIRKQLDDENAHRDDMKKRIAEIEAERKNLLAMQDQTQTAEIKGLYADSPDAPPGYESSPGASAAAVKADPKVMAALAETDRTLGMPAGTSARQIEIESSFDPNAVSPKKAMGLAQVTPDTLLGVEKNLGKKLNPFDPMDAVLIHREVMREDLERYGNLPDALRAYNSGVKRENWNNPETNAYVKKMLGDGSPTAAADKKPAATAKASDKKAPASKTAATDSSKKVPADKAAISDGVGKQMPAEAAAAEKQTKKASDDTKKVNVQVDVTHTHETPQGAPINTIKTPNTSVTVPVTFGTGMMV